MIRACTQTQGMLEDSFLCLIFYYSIVSSKVICSSINYFSLCLSYSKLSQMNSSSASAVQSGAARMISCQFILVVLLVSLMSIGIVDIF